MDVIQKSALHLLLPADIKGNDVFVVSSNPMEWRNMTDAFTEEIGKLTICTTTTQNGLPSTEFEYITVTHLEKEQYKTRFSAAIFFDPLSNEAALDIVKNSSLQILTDGGYVICVQNCNERGTYDQDEVRNVEKCLKDAHLQGTDHCLSFVSGRLIDASDVQDKVLYCSVHKRTVLESRNFIGTNSFQDVLNNQVYSADVPQMYEILYGKTNFISSGASENLEAVLKKLNLEPGSKVLDVGSGIGGFSFKLAKEYCADVYGIDLCMNLVDRATRTSNEIPELGLKVNFEVCDVSLRKFPEASFDAIFSKDVIYHIKDKNLLYKKFLTWLKPGGRLLVADFTRCDQELSDDFKSYVEFRKNTWYLLTLNEYEQCIKEAGFVDISADDVSYLQTNAIASEYEKMKNERETLIKDFGEESYNRWLSKLSSKRRVTESGDHSWGMFYGEKPQ